MIRSPRSVGAAILLALTGCRPAPVPPSPIARHAPVVLPMSEPERVHQMEQDLARLTSADAALHGAAYARLAQRARDGDRAARTVQLVFALRDGLRDGCGDAADRAGLRQALEFLEQQLRGAPLGEQVFLGPTLLRALYATGRRAEQPAAAAKLLAAGRVVLSDRDQALGELLFETAHALRQGCHLKAALPLLEEGEKLLERAGGGRSEPALLLRRDLSTLRFLLGDAKSAQRDLMALGADLKGAAFGEELQARMEVLEVLRAYLTDRAGDGPPPPRETGPGWQALRTVQEQASCPESTPADPRLLRIPLPPPPC